MEGGELFDRIQRKGHFTERGKVRHSVQRVWCKYVVRGYVCVPVHMQEMMFLVWISYHCTCSYVWWLWCRVCRVSKMDCFMYTVL